MTELKKLIDLKSIITLAVVGVFLIQEIRGIAPIEMLKEILMVVMVFYFAKKDGGTNV